MDKTIKIDIPFFKIMDADSKEKILKAVEEQLVKQLEPNVEVVDHISTDLIETADSLERVEQDGQDLAQLIDSRLENFFKNARFEIVEIEEEGEDPKAFRDMLNKYRVIKLDSTDPEPRVFKINKLE